MTQDSDPHTDRETDSLVQPPSIMDKLSSASQFVGLGWDTKCWDV